MWDWKLRLVPSKRKLLYSWQLLVGFLILFLNVFPDTHMGNLYLVKRWWKCVVSHTLWKLACLMCVLAKLLWYVIALQSRIFNFFFSFCMSFKSDCICSATRWTTQAVLLLPSAHQSFSPPNLKRSCKIPFSLMWTSLRREQVSCWLIWTSDLLFGAFMFVAFLFLPRCTDVKIHNSVHYVWSWQGHVFGPPRYL